MCVVVACVCEGGLSPDLGAVRAELRALGALLAPCGEVCASEKGSRASAAALHTHKHTHLFYYILRDMSLT